MTDLGNKEVFSKNLEKYMRLNNVDRKKVARDLGFKYTTFTDWCNGKTYPYIDKIDAIADYFKISKADLIENNENNTKLDRMEKDVVRVPVLSEVPISYPNEPIDEKFMVDYEEIPSSWAKANNKEFFALKVYGDSMEPIYNDGDIVVFQKTPYFTSGQDCCIRIDGKTVTIKRLTSKDNGILVSPLKVDSNDGFLPKLYTKEEIENLALEILGVVKKVVKYY